MLFNFYYAKKSTVEASEKFAEALAKYLTNMGIRSAVKDAGKYSCTLFAPGFHIPEVVTEPIRHGLIGNYDSLYTSPDTANFMGVNVSTSSSAVVSLAKSYHNRGNTLFETLG